MIHGILYTLPKRLSTISGMEWCNGTLEWNTDMTQMAQMFEITIPL